MILQPQPPTVAGDLRESIDEITYHLDSATDYLQSIGQLLDASRATRLLCRRGYLDRDRGTGLDLDSFGNLEWLLDEGVGQTEKLTEVLGPLLEPPRTSRTRYGRGTGIFARMPLDETKCGTSGNYYAHRRRGQDACQPCLKAHARYNAEWKRRQRKDSLVQLIELLNRPQSVPSSATA